MQENSHDIPAPEIPLQALLPHPAVAVGKPDFAGSFIWNVNPGFI